MMNWRTVFATIFWSISFFSTAWSQLTPPPMRPGDTLAIIATARSVQSTELQAAIDWAKAQGWVVELGRSIGKVEHQLAGPDWLRATDLQTQIDNPRIKMIWCAKGGYGTVRILDRVNFNVLQKKPKWIVGFSDVTALHQQLQTLGLTSVHGPVAISMKSAPDEVKQNLARTLKGNDPVYSFAPHPYNQVGKAQGKLIGGNLSVLYSLLGSPAEVDPKGCILFIEDLDEYLYHIDRMVINLKRNGYFEKLNGVIIGGFTKMRDNDIPWGKDAYQTLQSILREYNIPVIYDFPAGHIRGNQPLLLGKRVQIEVSATAAQLRYL